MEIIYMEQGKGKTTRLIEIANNKKILIIVSSRQRAFEIFKMAKDMNCKIHLPVTIEEAMSIRNSFVESFLIDDVENILSSILPREVKAISLTKCKK